MTNDARPSVLVVMGVAGSGKTTVARTLAQRLGWDFAEGDAMHPARNIARMTAGQPLTDADRQPWLGAVRTWIEAQTSAGKPSVVTCSALKRAYRDVLRADNVTFVHLAGGRELIAARIEKRLGHFMPASLLDSQFEMLEPLESDEHGVTVQIGESADDTVRDVLEMLGTSGSGDDT